MKLIVLTPYGNTHVSGGSFITNALCIGYERPSWHAIWVAAALFFVLVIFVVQWQVLGPENKTGGEGGTWPIMASSQRRGGGDNL